MVLVVDTLSHFSEYVIDCAAALLHNYTSMIAQH